MDELIDPDLIDRAETVVAELEAALKELKGTVI